MTTTFPQNILIAQPNLTAWPSMQSLRQTSARKGFLFFVAVAIALGVVAIIEPSPGDVIIALLLVQGFFCGNLAWKSTGTLPFLLLGLFVLSNLASLGYALDPWQGAAFLLITLFMVATWFFTVGILNRFQQRGLTVLMVGYSIGGVVTSLLAVLAYFHMLPFGEAFLFYDRIKGLFKDPNVFGPYLVVVVVYSLCRLQASGISLRRKALWLFSCLISSLGILLCFSRAAWANYVLTLFVFFVLNSIANRGSGLLRRNLAIFVVALVLIGGALAYAMTIPQVSDVIAYRSEKQAYDDDRFANQDAAFSLGLNNPLGVGPGQSFLHLNYATHSLYLRVFSENGAIGVFSLGIFMLLTLVRSLLLSQKSAHRFQRAMFAMVAAAIIGMLLNSFAIDTLHWRHFWILLALGWMPLWPAETNPQAQMVTSETQIHPQTIR
jgi:hypothetical protein